ncbi:MAG TPA: cytochrome c1 [Alphaproteobacteria bacterium]|nr:cytochrome c1 [Alphaproteobacteria bacterium]
MTNVKNLIAATVLALAAGAVPVLAQEHAVEIQRQPWTFAGIFGTYDQNQLQRGFQIFHEICSGCHSARLLAFRNLSEHGGPAYSEEQVKALAATFQIADPEAEGGVRPGVPADRWPAPMSEADALASFGVVPPDLSVMAKARSITTPFPWWILNYVTGYSEGGPDYIYALLTGYHDEVPAGVTSADGSPFELPEGKYYNEVFPGHAIGMSPPLSDGAVAYADETFPRTVDQYARDVAAFLMWLAEPHLVERKEAGFRVILFLILFAGLMYLVKEKLWAPIHHHNPSPEEVEAGRARKQSA